MKTTVKFLLLFTIAANTVSAQDFQQTRLRKIMFYNYNANKPRPDMVYDFFYDGIGNLTKINYSQDGKLFDVTDNFKYSATNKLLSYDNKGVKGISPRHHYISYDGEGRRTTKTETVLQDGKLVGGDVYRYYYKGDMLTRIKDQPTFGGHIFDTLVYKIDSDGYIVHPGVNKAHPNPMYLTGNAEVDMSDNQEWPVSKYFIESPVEYLPTFGTTTTKYTYDKNGLLTGCSWKYVTEKQATPQSTGRAVYSYIQIKKP